MRLGLRNWNLLLSSEGARMVDAFVLLVDVVVEVRGHEVWFVAVIVHAVSQ